MTEAFGADQAVQLLVDTLITSLKVSAPLLAVILVVAWSFRSSRWSPRSRK